MIDHTTIPTEMCARKQWICWREENRNGAKTKIPVDPKTGDFASSTDDRTWNDLETARENTEHVRADGLGFVFTSTDPIVGIDLDKCRDPDTGKPDNDAKAIIQQLDSYTEVSPSGTGYHVLVQGALPPGRNRRGGIEMYDQSRFFTVTTDHVRGTPTSINERQEELESIHEEFVGEAGDDEDEDDEDEDVTIDVDQDDDGTQNQETDLKDTDLLEKARDAGNGEKFDRLWQGHTSGYDSQSEADMALCCMLAFWTGGNRKQMDRLFHQSGLIRAKWDDVHYADGSTYGEKTLKRAIAATDEFYDPPTATVDTSVDTDGHITLETGTPTPGSEEVDGVYLKEKNALLEQHIDTLEATVADQRGQIDQLTEERQQLRSVVEQQENQPEQHTGRASGKDENRSSLGTRILRLLR